MNTKPFELYESEVRSYCRHFPAVFARAKDCFIFDEEGKRYIDFFCGAGADFFPVNFATSLPINPKAIFPSSVRNEPQRMLSAGGPLLLWGGASCACPAPCSD